MLLGVSQVSGKRHENDTSKRRWTQQDERDEWRKQALRPGCRNPFHFIFPLDRLHLTRNDKMAPAVGLIVLNC